MKKFNYHTQDFRKKDPSIAHYAVRYNFPKNLLKGRKVNFGSCSWYKIDGRAFIGNNVIVESKNGLSPFAMNRVYSIEEFPIIGTNSCILRVDPGYFQQAFYCTVKEDMGTIIVSDLIDFNGVTYYPHYRLRDDIGKNQQSKNFNKVKYSNTKNVLGIKDNNHKNRKKYRKF